MFNSTLRSFLGFVMPNESFTQVSDFVTDGTPIYIEAVKGLIVLDSQRDQHR